LSKNSPELSQVLAGRNFKSKDKYPEAEIRQRFPPLSFPRGMTMTNEETVSVLNDLIQVCKDGEREFQDCNRQVDDPELTKVFTDTAQRCVQGAEMLQDEVRRLGGEPATGGSLSGAAHRMWSNLKTAVAGNDKDSILEACEIGEQHAVEAYEKALQEDLPGDIRAMVEKQHHGVIANRDRVHNLLRQHR
jgi:uncharacterized protein (TIGR02284 family)